MDGLTGARYAEYTLNGTRASLTKRKTCEIAYSPPIKSNGRSLFVSPAHATRMHMYFACAFCEQSLVTLKSQIHLENLFQGDNTLHTSKLTDVELNEMFS